MKLQIDERSEVDLELPDLGVTVTLSGRALVTMARKAHNNKSRKCQGGPAVVRVTGKRPEAFENRYSVHYEIERENGHTSGVSISNVFRVQAEARFKDDVNSGRYTCVMIRGPREPKDQRTPIVCLKQWKTGMPLE